MILLVHQRSKFHGAYLEVEEAEFLVRRGGSTFKVRRNQFAHEQQKAFDRLLT
jgi:hypothetical protein